MAASAPLKSQIQLAVTRPSLRPAIRSGPVGCAVSRRSFPNLRVSSTYGERLDFGPRGVAVLGNNGVERRRVCGGQVRCTAEGIERGLFVGRKEGGFAVSERLKVVALVAAVMCLCNADRVVMSVAVVPLASKYGWSTSFLGIVQVPFSISTTFLELFVACKKFYTPPFEKFGSRSDFFFANFLPKRIEYNINKCRW